MKVQDADSKDFKVENPLGSEIRSLRKIEKPSLNPTLHSDGGGGAHNFGCMAHGADDV